MRPFNSLAYNVTTQHYIKFQTFNLVDAMLSSPAPSGLCLRRKLEMRESIDILSISTLCQKRKNKFSF